MKFLLNLTVTAMLILIAVNSSAQTFGIKGGLNLSNVFTKIEGDKFESDMKMNPGFHIGPTMELDLSDMFSIQSGLILSTKGFKYNGTVTDEDGNLIGMSDLKMNLYYLDIPLAAKAKIGFDRFMLFGIFGSSLGIGLVGKSKYELDGEKGTSTIKFGADEILKRLEVALTFGGGIEVNRFLFGLSYNLGLTNTSNRDPGVIKQTNRVLSISIGYKFGKQRTDKSDV